MLVYRLLINIIIQMPEYVKLCIYLRLPPRVVIYKRCVIAKEPHCC